MSLMVNMEQRDKLNLGALLKSVAESFRCLLEPKAGTVRFALQAALSAILALLAAFVMQLESPFWAAATALIVVNPMHGQVLAKGAARLVGTLIGGVMAVILTACFVQATDLFILVFALWIGVCTAAASLQRNFRTYAAALSGYTATLIVVSVVNQPNNILDITLARVAAISLGIVSSGLVSLLFSNVSAADVLQPRVSALIHKTAQLLKQVANGEVGIDLEKGCYSLAQETAALDALVEFASVESSEIKKRRADLHHIVANLMHTLTAIWALSKNLSSLPKNNLAQVTDFLREVAVMAEKLSVDLDSGDSVQTGREVGFFVKKYRSLYNELIDHDLSATHETLIASKNAARAIDQLYIVREGWCSYLTGEALPRRDVISYDVDTKVALVNGLRSFIAVLLSGIAWVELAWSDGASMMMMTAIGCSLFAASPKPTASGKNFFIGGVLAFFAGIIMYLLVLPHVDGFPLLASGFGFFIVFFIMCEDSSTSWLAAASNSAAVNFVMFMRFMNPMEYDFQVFLNRSVAQLVGMMCAVLAFVLIFPIIPSREIQKAAARLVREFQSIASTGKTIIRSAWESRLYDRLPRLLTFFKRLRGEKRLVVGDFFAMMQVGVELIALKNLLLNDRALSPTLRASLEQVMTYFAQLDKTRQDEKMDFKSLAKNLWSADANGEGERTNNHYAAAALYEISGLVDRHGQILAEGVKAL